MDTERWKKLKEQAAGRRPVAQAGRRGNAPVSGLTAPAPVVVRALQPDEKAKLARARQAGMMAETMFAGCSKETVFLAFQAFYMGCVEQMARAGGGNER